MRDAIGDRNAPGRRYAHAALGALVAGLVCLAVIVIATNAASTPRAIPLTTRLVRLATLGAVLGLPLVATIVAASKHRFALVARWIAVVLLGLLGLFFLGAGLVFLPALGLMLLASVIGLGDRDDRAAEAPTERESRSSALAGAAATFVLVGVVAAGGALRSDGDRLAFRCTVPPSGSIVAATGVRPDDVQEFTGDGEFNASATSGGRTIVFVTCDPASPAQISQALDEVADDPDRLSAGDVPFSSRRTDDPDLPLALSFVHDHALITIFVAEVVGADDARRLVDAWIGTVNSKR